MWQQQQECSTSLACLSTANGVLTPLWRRKHNQQDQQQQQQRWRLRRQQDRLHDSRDKM
jgi:hypothetical protein